MKHTDVINYLASFSSVPTLNSALLICCEEGNLELVKLLVQFGASLLCQDLSLNMNPLQIAASQG